MSLTATRRAPLREPALTRIRAARRYQATVPGRIVAPCPACRGAHVARTGPYGMPMVSCAEVPPGQPIVTSTR